jgi:formylglycine-generating enzyme required for sulfatase activity
VLNQKYSKSGKRFALPTEVQWEWACKAGHSMRVNSTEDPDRMPRYAWIGGNSDRETHPVGTKEPNDWGLYDMHGNVAEFVADVASGESGKHVVRGGEWRRGASECSCTARVLREAKVPFRCDGFRVMCTPAN